MNTAWPANKLALFFLSIMDNIRRANDRARRFSGMTTPPAESMTPNRMPELPAKGPMTPFNIRTVTPTPLNFICVQPTQDQAVDVSHVARHIQFWNPVSLDEEAFGVMVTRRVGANALNLLPHESARLLDLLLAAKEFLGQCETEPKQFIVIAISSDSRDQRPRTIWLEMSMVAGTYRITLTDM